MLLITGSRGQLGSTLRGFLPHAFAPGSSELDITDAIAVRNFVKRHNIDVIINCAAYTAVDKAEDDPETAERVNTTGPRNLARCGAAVVHVSTDYVFDGTSTVPYVEDMPTNPTSVYGWTKLRGEKEVLANASIAVVIRTSWLYSPYGANFVKTMLRLGAVRKSIGVVSDQTGSPTFCQDLAEAIAAIIPRLHSGVSGIYHYSDEGMCSWCDFAREIMRIAELPCRVDAIASAEYQTRAKRPAYSVLDTTKIKSTFGICIPHWKESLKKCLRLFS